jgi:hypothetical protein
MIDPVKIAQRIEEAFINVEVEDIAVKTITLPLKYLKILVRRPVTLPGFRFVPDRLCFIDNPCCKKCRSIWGARIKIGNHVKAN